MAEATVPKRIVIFADGTGDAFSTQDSNIWRLYEALDKTNNDQIAHYIKGVGTSGFRPFAIFDGATGVGVPANVRKLYEFICWNWCAGDDVYLFGFSRGAFTIRTLIGLIHHEGLVPKEIDGDQVSREEMVRNVMGAWRSYRNKTIPWTSCLPTIPLVRLLRDACLSIYHAALRFRPYRQIVKETIAQRRSEIPIKFAGLFDTVEAYGVPIEEFRHAIDWAIWPISFRNRILSPQVERACHALSLDDERVTFHPVRFDMGGEKTDRITEVWFSGVHSDVGGGYQDNALEYVPLVWMAEQASVRTTTASGVTRLGLRYSNGALDGFRQAASALGPRHDSRAGLGVFYRYGPRTLRADEKGDPPVIHHSVAEKMVFGCEQYAPIVLPSTSMVLLPDESTHRISGFQPSAALAVQPAYDPAMADALTALAAIRNPQKYIVSLVRDFVWWRRVAYLSLLFAFLLLIALPLAAGPLTELVKNAGKGVAQVIGADSLWAGISEMFVHTAGGVTGLVASLLSPIGKFIPGYAQPYVNVLTEQPVTCLAVVAGILILYHVNSHLRDRIADLARNAWFPPVRTSGAGQSEKTKRNKTIARLIRQSQLANRTGLFVADFMLPGLGIIVIYAAVVVGFTRGLVSVYDGTGSICKSRETATALPAGKLVTLPKRFETDQVCWASGVLLEKGRHYTIRLVMDHSEPYFDSGIMADAAGFTDSSLSHILALPIRRWLSLDWFQPVARIGSSGDIQWPLKSVIGETALPAGQDRSGKNFDPHFYNDPAFSKRLVQLRARGQDPTGWHAASFKISKRDLPLAAQIYFSHNFADIYVSQFAARADGELFLYINDAIGAVPFWGIIDKFYKNNTGKATVQLLKWDNPTMP